MTRFPNLLLVGAPKFPITQIVGIEWGLRKLKGDGCANIVAGCGRSAKAKAGMKDVSGEL